MIVSVIAGLATFALVVRARFEPARYTAAVAVAAIVAGWALAQSPIFLPGLTVKQAAAPHDVLVAITVAVARRRASSSSPRSSLLFRLTLGGRLGHAHEEQRRGARSGRELVLAAAPGLLGRVAGACLVAGFGLLTVAEAGWAHALGVVALFGFIVVGFAGAVPGAARGRARRLGRSPHREGDAHRDEGVLEAGAGLRRLARVAARGREQIRRRRWLVRRAGDDGPVTAVGRHDAVGLELAVGAGDRPAGQARGRWPAGGWRGGGRRWPAPRRGPARSPAGAAARRAARPSGDRSRGSRRGRSRAAIDAPAHVPGLLADVAAGDGSRARRRRGPAATWSS